MFKLIGYLIGAFGEVLRRTEKPSQRTPEQIRQAEQDNWDAYHKKFG